jgi:hypothetical protein
MRKSFIGHETFKLRAPRAVRPLTQHELANATGAGDPGTVTNGGGVFAPPPQS